MSQKVKNYIKALKTSKSKKEAALKAGYSEKTNTVLIESTDTFQRFQAQLDRQIPDEKVIKAFADGLEADKTLMTKHGAIAEPDHPTRIKSATEIAKLKGRYKQLETQVNILAPIQIKWEDDN